MTAYAASEGVNPYVALLLPVVTLVLGAVLTYFLRERSARSDRQHAAETDLRRWMRQERRAVYARFIAANDKSFNAAATAERRPGPGARPPLTDAGRTSVEAAHSEAATLFAELQLLCGEDSDVVRAARELLLFHQTMVNAALNDGSWVPDANARSHELTRRFLSVASQDLGGAT